MNDKIKDMRGFLMACHLTAYLLPEQIALLTMGLDALENQLLFANKQQIQEMTNTLELKAMELKGGSI